jgi:hypothetical protein
MKDEMETDRAMTDLASPSDYLAVLTETAIAFRAELSGRNGSPKRDRPSSNAVVGALLQAEKVAKQQHLTYPFESLQGQWRLCFTANRKAHEQKGIAVGKGWFVPTLAPAQISFNKAPAADAQDAGEIGNQVQLGPILVRFTGPCRYLGKKNLLPFDFTQLQICLLGRSVYQGSFRGGKPQEQEFYTRSIAKLPFFAFFLITDQLIAARGRGGGLALWIRVDEKN